MTEQMESATGQSRMQLREYLAVIRLRKWTVLVVTAFILGGALGFSARQTPMYKSSARVLVQEPSVSAHSESGGQQKNANLQTEVALVSSTEVTELAAERLSLEGKSDNLPGHLDVSVVEGTEILEFVYEAPAARFAQRGAQSFARAYLDFRKERVIRELNAAAAQIKEEIKYLEEQQQEAEAAAAEEGTTTEEPVSTSRGSSSGRSSGGDTGTTAFESQIADLNQERVSLLDPEDVQVGHVVQPAQLPSSPFSPDHVRNGVFALIGGLLLGIGVAFLRERLDDRLRGRLDLEAHAGAPVLAVIPRIPGFRRGKQTRIVALEEPKSAPAEAFRTLRTGLLFAASQRQAKTVLIASPHTGEGKTVVAANLAVSLAHARKRVILVSADIRKPRLHRFFKASKEPGLTNVLAGEIPPADALIEVGVDNLRFLPSGPVPGNPAELLSSDAMGRLIASLSDIADFVLIDSPSILVVSDTLAMAPLADAVLFLAQSERTTRGSVDHARRLLDQVDARVLGAVLNNFDVAKAGAASASFYYEYYPYAYKLEEPRGRRLWRRSKARMGRGDAAAGFGEEPYGDTAALASEPARIDLALAPEQVWRDQPAENEGAASSPDAQPSWSGDGDGERVLPTPPEEDEPRRTSSVNLAQAAEEKTRTGAPTEKGTDE